ncbi:MAG: Dps family protein [Pseudobdellovibrionaceae bacterium]
MKANKTQDTAKAKRPIPSQAQNLQQEQNPEVAEALQLVLADTFVLYMKTYAVHWNYQGPKFFSVHKLTEEQYQQLAESIDEIAERLRAMGRVAPISLETILANSDLEEMRKRPAQDDQALLDLISGHTLLSKRAHQAALTSGDASDLFSQDMMIQRVGAHDKAIWMLRSFLQHGELKASKESLS